MSYLADEIRFFSPRKSTNFNLIINLITITIIMNFI